MPELPEVEITVRKLQFLCGKIIIAFKSDWPRGLKAGASDVSRDIKTRKILSVGRLGKAILWRLGGKDRGKNEERILAFHQRMSGRLVILESRSKNYELRKLEEKHVRVKILFSDGTELFFVDPRKFGIAWYGKPEEVMRDAYFLSLGADALAVSFKKFKDHFHKHRGMIKPLLLRQDVLAGVGNIVADEMLWGAKIHPQRTAETLTNKEIRDLFRAMKTVLRRSIKAQGTTLRDWGHPDGGSGNFQNLMRVYGQKGKKCPRCGNLVKRMVVGGRGTWICSCCQHRF